MNRKIKKDQKSWKKGILIVVESHRVNGELPFFEQPIERWRLPSDAKRIYGFEFCERDNEKYHQRIRELLAMNEVVLLQMERSSK